ncbi:unnamed protein product [Darwinula stevensoni]|uniref:TraB domain-containing protein n=1 Tax=Darwinula stevensoni TaxID=69355 RepID=A0A7R8ZZ07_9CRUS|nr:unnamed protein product [Darwinula stevensoni]CAG0882544.1 unnamed protein product [Darwinula stevensoni]
MEFGEGDTSVDIASDGSILYVTANESSDHSLNDITSIKKNLPSPEEILALQKPESVNLRPAWKGKLESGSSDIHSHNCETQHSQSHDSLVQSQSGARASQDGGHLVEVEEDEEAPEAVIVQGSMHFSLGSSMPKINASLELNTPAFCVDEKVELVRPMSREMESDSGTTSQSLGEDSGIISPSTEPMDVTPSEKVAPMLGAQKVSDFIHSGTKNSEARDVSAGENDIENGSPVSHLDEGEWTEASEEDTEENEAQHELTDVNFNEKELPTTVSVLKAWNGSKVFLVGTAHFSRESQQDVAKTISMVQPHVVMVELCKSRVSILSMDEETIIEEAKNINFEKIKASMKENGVVQGLLYLLLLNMTSHITKELGMAPGGEFRTAFHEAKNVPHCIVQLGDRPIQITLQRALGSLGLRQKIKLAWHLITCKDPISKEEVEKCKNRDLLEEMLAEMAGEFPALDEVFVKERDLYLTHSLHLATSQSDVPMRVVGVVGIGHVPGIVRNWNKKLSEVEFSQLLLIPPPSRLGRVIKFTIKASFLGLTAYACYRIFPFPKIVQESVQGFTNKIRTSFGR